MKKIKFLSVISLAIFVALGCKKSVLEVTDQNTPTFKDVYSDGSSLVKVAGGLFNTIYVGEHAYNGVEMCLATAADNVTCSWGNQAMRDMSWEPRNHAWDNSAAYSYAGITEFTWAQMYGTIGVAANILQAIYGGTKIDNPGDEAMTRSVSRFTQGVAYGNLALLFDKAYVVDSLSSVHNPGYDNSSPYTSVANAALGYLDSAIAIASSSSFTIPASWFGTASDMSSSDFVKLCNTCAARILSYTPRNKTQLQAVNWAKVKTYADAGITTDFSVVGDSYTNWYDEAGDYLTYDGWGLTDMYVVNLMDPTEPAHWDDSPTFPYPPVSTNPNADKRLNTDFEYVSSNWLNPTRGYYHFSNYRSNRYDQLYISDIGPKPEIMKAENDMLRAEARAYTGDLAGAAAIINASTWKTRGGLPDVAADLTSIVNAIHHERFVEMYTTGMGLQFFEMRKLNLLQKGTPLHFPIPAQEMQKFGQNPPYYTFGDLYSTEDGINTSNAGWR
ncbi:MAG TPA: hypothetical protein VHD35_15270 [Chitinophagaceae bacterium]|nr:hypothetical protein [Chitinophagaceae bacterium]